MKPSPTYYELSYFKNLQTQNMTENFFGNPFLSKHKYTKSKLSLKVNVGLHITSWLVRGEEQIDMMISAASELDLSGAMENLNYLSNILYQIPFIK